MTKQNHSVHIDFETRSDIDLAEVGTVVYATHARTLVLLACITWRGEQYVFKPHRNRKAIRKLMKAIHESGDTIVAYNWLFEYYIMRYTCTRLYGWPEFTIDRFECSRATALRYGLPGQLNADTAFMGTATKDNDGHRVMMRLTKPYKPTAKQKKENPERSLWFDNDIEKHSKNERYCIQDVKAETELLHAIPALSKRERKIFRVDQAMNTHGISVDLELCSGAVKIFEHYKVDLTKQIPQKAWQHFDRLTQREKVKAYLNEIEPTLHLEDMQATTIEKALRTCTNGKARRIMNAYSEMGGQAVNKFNRVLASHYNGKLYGELQYCGAAGTGRWSGQGVQLHNMNRPTMKHDSATPVILRSGDYAALEEYRHDIRNYNDEVPSISEVIKTSMRNFIIPRPGTYLAINDYKAIEARLVFWCSGCDKGLNLFRSGRDPYVAQASVIYDVKVKKVQEQQRFVGKQNILGAGYGMGAPRFKDQCEEHNVFIGMGLAAKSIGAYREQFWQVPKYWNQLENTILTLLQSNIKHKWAECGPVEFMYDGVNVQMRLPAGTILTYHKMHCSDDDKLHYYTTPTIGPRKMMIRSIWGGTILQNICEAIARDLMADAMIRLHALEYWNLFTVHDELANEIPHPDCMPEVQACILTLNKWSKDIPLEIEGKVLSDCYRKI